MKKYFKCFIVFGFVFSFIFTNLFGSINVIRGSETKGENPAPFEQVKGDGNDTNKNKDDKNQKINKEKNDDVINKDDKKQGNSKHTKKEQGSKKTKEAAEEETEAEEISLDFKSKKILKGQSYTLNVRFLPKGSAERELIFKSENTKVASVSSKGVIKGLSYGQTVINIKTKDEKLSINAVIQVVPKYPTVKLKNYLSKSIKISWNKVSGMSGYRIYYKTSKSGEYKFLTAVSKTGTYFVHRKLKSNKTYCYKVVSYVKVKDKNIYSSYKEKSLKAVSKSYVTVMLDPGHRGKYGRDYGAKGIDKKTWEVTLNDKFVSVLAGKLKKEGYNVIYSRKPYKKLKFKNLRELSKYANKKKPDLFVSVHHNSSTSKKANGYAIYYSTYKKYLDSKGLYVKIYSKKYGSGRKYYKVTKIKYSKSGSPTIYFKYGKKTKKISPSSLRYNLIDKTPCSSAVKTKRAASYVNKEIKASKILRPFEGGMVENDFIVTSETNAPSFMLEAGFVSNKSELSKLKNSKFRDKYTSCLIKGINKYFGVK